MSKWMFFLAELFNNIRRSGLMMFIVMIISTFSLILFGLFLILSFNLNHWAETITSNLEVRVFLNETLTKQEISFYQKQLATTYPGSQVEFVHRDTSWRQFKDRYQTLTATSYFEDSPFPHTIKILFSKKHHVPSEVKKLQGQPYYVKDVVFGGGLAQQSQSFSRFIRIAGWSCVTLFSIFSLMVIGNVIRLTVINRQVDIEIMQLVGASNWFISGPFLLEGIFIGMTSAAFACVVIQFCYRFIANMMAEHTPFIPIILNQDMFFKLYAIVLGLGVTIGFVGALISISKSLKLR